MGSRACVLAVLLCAMAGCAGSQAMANTSAQAGAERYAAALDEAFDLYAEEVQSAALLDYASAAEADAVVRTLSDRHFDHQLGQALARRGLSREGLARYADAHPDFFHAQQRLHWGRLQRIESTLATIPMRVRPAQIDDSLLAAETAPDSVQ